MMTTLTFNELNLAQILSSQKKDQGFQLNLKFNLELV